MAIEFPCQQCQCELRVDDQDVDKKARCPRCGMIQAVPRTFADLDEEVTSHTNDTDDTSTNPGDQETVYRSPDETPDLLLTNSELLWSMQTPDGSVYGPVDRRELESWVVEGRVSSQCLVRQAGRAHWQSALTLFPNLAAMPPKRKPFRKAAPVEREYFDVEQIRLNGGLNTARTHGGTGVLILSLIGIMMPCFPIFSIIAMFWGWGERRGIAAGTVRAENRMVLDIGFFLGIAGSVIGLVGFSSCFMG